MKLIKSKVIFNPEAHTYHLDGVQLQGITGMLGRQLFADKYNGVPERIMQKAAEKGSLIHSYCELADNLGIIPDNEEAQNYIRLKEENKLKTIANEYLVSDNKHFASCIDIIFKSKGNNVKLADIKTTYKLDLEYISWQLSIYKYLFELQNPKIKVDELLAIWLKGGKSEMVTVKCKSEEEVLNLLNSEINGTQLEVKKQNFPSEIINAEQSVFEIKSQIKLLEQKEKELKDGLLTLMNKHDIKSYKGELITITKKEAYKRTSIDSKKLKEHHSDAYNDCVKETEVKESIDIKLNDIRPKEHV